MHTIRPNALRKNSIKKVNRVHFNCIYLPKKINATHLTTPNGPQPVFIIAQSMLTHTLCPGLIMPVCTSIPVSLTHWELHWEICTALIALPSHLSPFMKPSLGLGFDLKFLLGYMADRALADFVWARSQCTKSGIELRRVLPWHWPWFNALLKLRQKHHSKPITNCRIQGSHSYLGLRVTLPNLRMFHISQNVLQQQATAETLCSDSDQ